MSVSVAWDGAVATVTVDNPPVNPLDDATLAGLRDAALQVGEARAVVLTGAGEKAFLAGADLRSLRHALGTPGAMEEHVALTRPTFDAWRALEMPLIAAVAAHAVGGGLEFALLCDLVVAAPKARFGLPEVTLGLIPGGGGTQRLPRRIGSGLALELMLTGKLVTAAEAPGLVNIVADDPRAAARELAERIARLPALAVRAIKRAGRFEGPLDAGLDLERALFLEVAGSADAREGADAFLEKRRPDFAHR
jgi:enoyl-CoA hydratase/carnithine racemase